MSFIALAFPLVLARTGETADRLRSAVVAIRSTDFSDRPNPKVASVMRMIAAEANKSPAKCKRHLESITSVMPHALQVDPGTITFAKTEERDRSIVSVRIGPVSGIFVFDAEGKRISSPVPLDWINGFNLVPIAVQDGLLVKGTSIQDVGPRFTTRMYFAPRGIRGYAISKTIKGEWCSTDKGDDWISLEPTAVTLRTISPLKTLTFKPSEKPVIFTQQYALSAARPRQITRQWTNSVIRDIDDWIGEAKDAPTKDELQKSILDHLKAPLVQVNAWTEKWKGGHQVILIDTTDSRLRFTMSRGRVTHFTTLKLNEME